MSNDDLLCWERHRDLQALITSKLWYIFMAWGNIEAIYQKVPVSRERSINTFLICCLKLLAYLCRIDVLIYSLRTGYTCNYTSIFSARERIIQAGTDHVCSPCTPCCILCFLVLASFSVYNLNYFGSLAGFQSACSFTFLKLCWFPECKCLHIF